MKTTISLAALCAFLLLSSGCSKLKDAQDLPTNPAPAGIHPAGFGDKASTNFHAISLRAAGDDYSSCQRCHGTDLKGGLTGQSCAAAGCHGKGYHPAGFGDKASQNFHAISLRQGGDDLTSCKACHGANLAGTPLSNNLSCLTSGCHGEGGVHPEGWADPASPKFHAVTIRQINWSITHCTVCHATDYSGTPLSNNVSCNQSGCHVAADGGPKACYTCHGNPATKAVNPPVGLSGSSASSDPGVGAHVIHLAGGTLTGTVVACASCHNVPASFDAPGHIDANDPTPGRAEVFLTDTLAAIVTLGRVNLPVAYNPATHKCENTYCHGNFTNGNNFQPQWNGTDQAKCGTCHGDPATGNPMPKSPHFQIATCSVCHTETMNSDNLTIKDKSKHMDGKLEVYGNTRTDW